jgi:hypothetical protein
MNYNNVTLHRGNIMRSKLFLAIFYAVLFTISATISFNLKAEQSLSVEYGFYTTHISESPSGEPYNEDNNLIGIEYNVNDWYFTVATYDNSFNNRSNAIGAGYNLLSGYGFNFDVLFGLVTGYTDEAKTVCYDGLCGYIAPRVSYTFDVSENIGIKPTAQLFYNAVVLSVGVEYRF